MTLIATVLLSAIAATIALVLVRQTVLIARAESVRSDYDSAYQSALDVKAQFERQLAKDPAFYTKRLFSYERPRLCTRSGVTQAIIPPEQPALVDNNNVDAPHDTAWPTTCAEGNTWTYLAAGQSAVNTDDTREYTPQAHPVRVEITPPSPGQPNLVLKVLAVASHDGQDTGAAGAVESGLTATYRPSSATAVTAYSQSDLRLDSVYNQADASGGNIAVRGTLYSGGQMYLPTGSSDFTGAQVLAEDGFIGAVPDTGRFYTTVAADPSAADGSRGVRDVRTVVTNPLTLDGLRGAYSGMEAVGCPETTTPPAFSTTPAGVRYQSSLCLRYGKQVATGVYDTTTGVIGGDRPAAYLLKFAGTRTNPTVQVWTAATPPATPGDCVIECDLTSVSLPDFNANKHPESPPAAVRTGGAGAALWQPLGEFAMPSSGVLMTDADTYIGQCPRALAGASAACDTTVANASVTIVAGTPRDPRNVIVAGPLDAVSATTGASPMPAARVGLVATKALVVPFYARPSAGSLDVHANIVAFGYGLKRGESALRSFPATQAAQAENPANWGKTLTITGSIAAPSLEAALPGWERINLAADTTSVATPPPYFPGFTQAWGVVGSDRLSSFDVCGASSCSTIW